ncbi:MAG: hypothetical protein KatS3mg031_2886 [Chitinophagales bacterium]|nr:MAG: hypothetical protein KatS3mg031_2886 [Chitinophagales bacterium]
MLSPDGRKWKEDRYEGYGVFGGKDIYELIAELNGKKTRSEGIDLVFDNNPTGSFAIAAARGVKLPLLTEGDYEYHVALEKFGYPETCRSQGYFYDYDEEE